MMSKLLRDPRGVRFPRSRGTVAGEPCAVGRVRSDAGAPNVAEAGSGSEGAGRAGGPPRALACAAMWSAGAGFASGADALRAAQEACRAAAEAAGGADAALLFAGPGLARESKALLEAARSELGTRQLVGGLAHGVLAQGREDEGGASVAALALRGLEAESFWIPELAGREERIVPELRARLDGAGSTGDLVVLIPDPQALRPQPLLEAVAEAAGGAAVVGAGAAEAPSQSPLLWSGGDSGSGGLAGLVLRGASRVRVGVTQACRPVTAAMEVTAARGPWVLELDGRPALDVYREAAGGVLAQDLARAAHSVMAALPVDPAAPLPPGGYRVRNVGGFSEEKSAFAVADALSRGDALALVQREPETARDDLLAMLDGLGSGSEAAGLALYFNCCARGAGFFGVPGLESAYLSRALGETPLAGMFGSCELGPIAGRTELLTYTGVLAVLDR